jgi:hypothetical protein
MRIPSLFRLTAAALGVAIPLSSAACNGGGGASYPDRSDVTAAQAAWCQALGKLYGGAEKWDKLAECKAAYPTASAPFLRGMTKCFVARHDAAGTNVPDNSQLVADCTDEVTIAMKGGTSAGAELVDARCDRMNRCEKVAVPECKAAFEKLETSQRMLLTVRFNGAAINTIAQCLISSSCNEDEDAGRDACYKPTGEKLLWFP